MYHCVDFKIELDGDLANLGFSQSCSNIGLETRCVPDLTSKCQGGILTVILNYDSLNSMEKHSNRSWGFIGLIQVRQPLPILAWSSGLHMKANH